MLGKLKRVPYESEPTSVYRIERRAAGVLHLYRGEHLVDADRDSDDDSLEDIERWGSGIAWAENYTNIQRWQATEVHGTWQILVGIPYRYVTWQSDDDGVTSWDEIDDSNWATRHIEATGPEQIYRAAASLPEVIAARDIGGIDAVRAYEQTYGVVPEAAFPGEILSGLATVSSREFLRRWTMARNALESATS